MILGVEPAFERVRAVLQNDPSASDLLLRCRAHMRRAHDCCQFPSTALPLLMVNGGGLRDHGNGETLIDAVVGRGSPSCIAIPGSAILAGCQQF
jgi:hypothetical protein